MKITLGIDIGTTKCAAVLWDADKRQLLESCSKRHEADLKTTPERAEQSPAIILQTVRQIITQLPQDLRNQVSAVGMTGQMHSVMGWNKEEVFLLITWQDRRCGHDGTLEEFCRKSGRILHDGYGAATLAHLGNQSAS